MSYHGQEAFLCLVDHLNQEVKPLLYEEEPEGWVAFFAYAKIYDNEDPLVLKPRLLEAAKELAKKLNRVPGPLQFYGLHSDGMTFKCVKVLKEESVCMIQTISYISSGREEVEIGYQLHELAVKFRGDVKDTLDEQQLAFLESAQSQHLARFESLKT